MSEIEVVLELPADPGYSTVARGAAARVAALHGFTVDRIDDMRLAVSEVFAALSSERSADECVRLSMTPASPGTAVLTVVFSAGVPSRASEPFASTMAWGLASVLVDSAVWQEDPNGVTVKLAIRHETPGTP